MTVEKHLCSVSRAAAQRLSIKRKSWHVWSSLLIRSFWIFALPVFEYCSAVRCSAADSHLKLPDRDVLTAVFLAGGVLECILARRRSLAMLCMLFMIKINSINASSGRCLASAVCVGACYMRSVLWLLIGNRLCLLGVELLCTAWTLCPFFVSLERS